jgi:hypothetical protein
MALTAYGFECAFGVGFGACTTSFIVVHSTAQDLCMSRVAEIQTKSLEFREVLDYSFYGNQCNVEYIEDEGLGFRKLVEGRICADQYRIRSFQRKF